ncbi:HPr kinase/phosphorylase [Rhodobacter ferrooxidans]|uniref:HPr kinase n=1 Tax=Rhodobacter ferrooxidans TaxID=371731 RepID=C8S2J9_9RHOB|nr:HPr kinase/phosphatase C-terminal domain-containing protein [Rhodobacter sp. SW2]EEW24870.1 HPr kinase [Rhodobacter sp. SW2]
MQTLHASCVAVDGRGLLILGPSGSGKSGLALQLMALGAGLVADDQTEIRLEDAALIARCPAPLRGLIEARGIGLLNALPLESAPLHLVVDLGQSETQRLPPKRHITLMNQCLDLVLGQDGRHFPSALLQMLRFGRQA